MFHKSSNVAVILGFVILLSIGDGVISQAEAHHETQTVFLGTTTVAGTLALSSIINTPKGDSRWEKAGALSFSMPGAMIGTALGATIHHGLFGHLDAETAFLGHSFLLGDGLSRAVLTTGFGIAGGILASRIGYFTGGKASRGSGLAKSIIGSMSIIAIPSAGMVFGIQWVYTDW